ncbi:MAG: hypothetical protein EOO20_17600 [Chryseobacterium sp.]|nr:MAG: hypothetical protein EOO20_17600 [Chryseobacterium sp.]
MVNLRPHVLKFTLPGTPPTVDENGYDVPGIPGEEVEIPCRYHPSGKDRKQFTLDDGSVIVQQGRIRLDVGSLLPKVGQSIDVPGYFTGVVRDTYKGQLTYHIDV